MMKKPAVFTALGVAAAVALMVTLFVPGVGDSKVAAAEIIQKFNEQMEANPRLEITLESLAIDEVFVNGHLQLSEQGIAGDVHAIIDEDEGKIEVDAAIGLTDKSGWILVRSLTVPDPQAQALLGLFMPPGGELLLHLPMDGVETDFSHELHDAFKELRSEELTRIFLEIVEGHAEFGATVENQADGTVLLTLAIEDEAVLDALKRFAKSKADSLNGGDAKASVHVTTQTNDDGAESVTLSGDERKLIGSTITVVYDPSAEMIRSFGIENLGSSDGRVQVNLLDGLIDAELLDSDNFVTANTRTFDLGALESMIKQFESK